MDKNILYVTELLIYREKYFLINIAENIKNILCINMITYLGIMYINLIFEN